MRIFNKEGKQIGVQDNETKKNFFFDKKDIETPPKDFYIATESKKPTKKSVKE